MYNYLAAVMAMLGGVNSRLGVSKMQGEKLSKKCLLPGCENKIKHNGGYCCAEHCKEHGRKLKEMK